MNRIQGTNTPTSGEGCLTHFTVHNNTYTYIYIYCIYFYIYIEQASETLRARWGGNGPYSCTRGAPGCRRVTGRAYTTCGPRGGASGCHVRCVLKPRGRTRVPGTIYTKFVPADHLPRVLFTDEYVSAAKAGGGGNLNRYPPLQYARPSRSPDLL